MHFLTFSLIMFCICRQFDVLIYNWTHVEIRNKLCTITDKTEKLATRSTAEHKSKQ